jgi:uncharacterized OsmC-like protein
MSLKETLTAFKADPSKGERKFNIRIEDNGGMSFKISMGDKPHVIYSDSPPSLGGEDKGASPLLMTLGVIGACVGTVIKFWAKVMEVKIDNIDISMRGNINLSSIFGIGNQKAAFSDLKPVVRLTTSEDKAKIDALLKNVDEHCPAFFLVRDANFLKWDVKIEEKK